MALIRYIFLVFSISVLSQSSVEIEFIIKEPLKVDQLIDANQFDGFYAIQDNAFQLMQLIGSTEYSNIQMGVITSANAFNPLKINLFYRDFNSAVILDNRLAEIIRIDFNTLQPFRMVSHISTGNDNTIWLYDQNTQQLELFDYLTRKTRITTLPIESHVLDLKSNFNFCWLLTEKFVYKYNYVGSLVDKFPNDGYSSIDENNGNIILLRENQLFLRKKNEAIINPIKHDGLLIKQFLVTNETLYIYDGEFLHQYQLKMN